MSHVVGSGCACLRTVDLFAKTSSVNGAESYGTHQLQIKRLNGESDNFTLSDLPGKDKSKLWTFNLSDPMVRCAFIFDIESIAINAISGDGWNINTAVTVLVDSKDRVFTGSIDRGINAWVDHLDLPEYESIKLTLTGHN